MPGPRMTPLEYHLAHSAAAQGNLSTEEQARYDATSQWLQTRPTPKLKRPVRVAPGNKKKRPSWGVNPNAGGKPSNPGKTLFDPNLGGNPGRP